MKQIRRRVHRVLPTPTIDGTYVFRAKSFTRKDGTVHYCTVNPKTGIVTCTCEAFKFTPGTSKYRMEYVPGHCKHLIRAVETTSKFTVSTP